MSTHITAPDAAGSVEPIRVLLVEDDDGDALIVEEELELSGAAVELDRARTLARRPRRSSATSTACCWTSTCPTPRA